MIERRNIVKLLSERTKANVYHSAVLTCFNFDPIFFESVYLSALRSLGVTNIIVIMDAGMYDNLLDDVSYNCHKVSSVNYTLVRLENMHHGVFHTKMTLLFGEDEGVIIVGSGNLTFSGLYNNEEVWNAFHVKGNQSIHYPLFYKSWVYIQNLLTDSSSLVQKQLKWMSEQSMWLQSESTQEVVTLATGDKCSLLFNDANSGILDKVYNSIDGAKVEEIIVVVPYYDADGNALSELMQRFNPQKMLCVLDLGKQSAPYKLLDAKSGMIFGKHLAKNPLHAKIIEFRTPNGTWVLTGSANAGNMALGINKNIYNEEACILLYNKKNLHYINELGVQYEVLKEEERKAIERPQQVSPKPSVIQTVLRSSEEIEGKICLRFSIPNVNGVITIFDKNQNIIFEEGIVSKEFVSLNIDENLLPHCHCIVLMSNGVCISNRSLVLREVFVESCNPDPKRRKLASLLDDTQLLNNLRKILGYIEFDEDEKIHKAAIMATKLVSSINVEDVVVRKDQFDKLKESSLSISMHSGIRILTYLKQLLFKKVELVNSDDELLEIDKEEQSASGVIYRSNDITDTACSIASDASKMRNEIVSFLLKMSNSLTKMTKDTCNHRTATNRVIPNPDLVAVPGLNAGSAIAVAARAVIVMMNKYGANVQKRLAIRESLVKCARLFASIFANGIPSDNNRRSCKIRELIRDASVDLFAALCFFDFEKKDVTLPLVVLNFLDLWKGKEELSTVMPLYEKLLLQLCGEKLYPRTIKRIREVAEAYLNGIPTNEYHSYDTVIYQYRTGHGFILVDNIKLIDNKVLYDFHSSWFDGKVSGVEKHYIGFSGL